MYTLLQRLVSDFNGIFPEIFLVVSLIVLLFIDLFNKKASTLILPIGTAFAFFITMVLVYVQWKVYLSGPSIQNGSTLLYKDFLKLDYYSCYFKFVFCFAGILTTIFSVYSTNYSRQDKGEFYYLLVSVVLGMHFLVMSNNLLMMFVSLELISICSYVLTITNFDKNGTESSIKYILFGAFCTGIMLFGISLLYGITGSFDFPVSIPLTALGIDGPVVFIVAIFLMLTGLFFKASLFPFHIWTPDIYQGAPTPIVAFFSVAPKAAAFGVLLKVLPSLLINSELSEILTLLLASIAILTMTLGNFSALVQTNLRRMMAYSAIGHAGFMLMAILTIKDLALTSILFYLVVYLFMNFTAFSLIDHFAGKVGSYDVNNFKGLGLKMPFLGGIFVLTMISLTGLPPTAGFYAKLFVFTALWETYQLSGNQLFLVLLFFGLFNTIVSLFFYLRIPYFIYFKKDDSSSILTSGPYGNSIFIALISLPLLILFFNPNWVLTIIQYIKL